MTLRYRGIVISCCGIVNMLFLRLKRAFFTLRLIIYDMMHLKSSGFRPAGGIWSVPPIIVPLRDGSLLE